MKMSVHKILWSDKKIEAKRGTHRVSSMWEGGGVYKSMEIVPERFRRGRVFWVPVSWKGSAISDLWLRAIPYLRFSREQSGV